MRKVNIQDVPTDPWASPKRKFACISRGISLALGRREGSDLKSESPPFDLELCTIQAGAAMCPYHSHSAQWELYVVVSGRGQMRAADGLSEVGPGDAFIFPPGEPHQLIAPGPEDFVVYIIADNPVSDACYYPDSDKWLIPTSTKRHVIKGASVDYLDGEE
jgi:uncharacterized cupin superfamily protein